MSDSDKVVRLRELLKGRDFTSGTPWLAIFGDYYSRSLRFVEWYGKTCAEAQHGTSLPDRIQVVVVLQESDHWPGHSRIANTMNFKQSINSVRGVGRPELFALLCELTGIIPPSEPVLVASPKPPEPPPEPPPEEKPEAERVPRGEMMKAIQDTVATHPSATLVELTDWTFALLRDRHPNTSSRQSVKNTLARMAKKGRLNIQSPVAPQH